MIENQEERFKKHIEVLSSSELKGRLAGTTGASKAADYLVSQLRQMGVKPLGMNEYLQPLEVPTTRITDAVTLKVDNWRLRHRIDFGEMRLSSGGEYSGKLLVMRDGEDIEKNPENKVILISQIPQDFDLESTVKAGVELGIKGVILEEGEPRWCHKTSAAFSELGIPVIRVRKSIAEELEKRKGSTVTISLPIEISSKKCNNVIGVLAGKDTSFTVALTAHYDHIGDDPKGFRFSGAFDNASGVSVILELVHKLKQEHKILPFNLLICFLTGEESGYWGAKHLMQHQPLPLSAVINFDVLGLDPELKEVRIGQIDPENWLSKLTINTLDKYNVISRRQRGNDDSEVFLSKGIPTIGFGEYNIHNIGPKIHTPDDNVEDIHYEQLAKVIEIVFDMLDQISIQLVVI